MFSKNHWLNWKTKLCILTLHSLTLLLTEKNKKIKVKCHLWFCVTHRRTKLSIMNQNRAFLPLFISFLLLISNLRRQRQELCDFLDLRDVNPVVFSYLIHTHRTAMILSFPLIEKHDVSHLRHVQRSLRHRFFLIPCWFRSCVPELWKWPLGTFHYWCLHISDKVSTLFIYQGIYN